MSEERIQAMIASACFDRAAEDELARDPADFLARRGVPAEDIQAMGESAGRLALYRRLVRNNLVGVVQRMMPRTRARLNDAGGAFDASFDAFLELASPRTHYLRDVPAEFLAWVTPRWKSEPSVPSYLADLAAHELVEFEICAAPAAPAPPPVVDVSLERSLVFVEAKRIMRYAHGVHLLPADEDDRTVPEPHAVTLLVYRDDAHAARFLELSDLAAAILERLFAGEALGDAVRAACAAAQPAQEVDGAVLEGTARLLADLGERGVLLGARPA